MTEPTAELGDNFGALGGLIGGFAKGSMMRAEARASEAAGRNVLAAANEREDQSRRESRQTLGEQVAAIAQSGIGFTQTTRDTMDQSAANASMDALNERYKGIVANVDYQNKAAELRSKASAAPIVGAFTGATKALMFMKAYGG